MEETNYHRAPSSPRSPTSTVSEPALKPLKRKSEDEKIHDPTVDQERNLTSLEAGEGSLPRYRKKSYVQKLALFQKSDLKKPNRIAGMMLRPLIFLSFPVIFYAGFSYGSNLVVGNV